MFSRKETPEQRIARVFDELDEDGDGTIPMNEVRHLLSENRRQVNLKDGQILALLDEADKNRDNVLDLNEFLQLITSARAQKSAPRRMMYSIADTVIARTERPTVHTYLDEYNCLPPPLFIIAISLAQVFVFVGYHLDEKKDLLTECQGCFIHQKPGPLLFAPPLRHEVWRFLTYQFLHQGLYHLVPNLVFQIVVGVPLEVVHKSWRIAPLYLLAVALGALLQYTLDPAVYLIGCSAGVYALIAAHLSNVIINWAEMPFRVLRLVAVLGFVAFDVGGALYRRLQSDVCDQVSYTAHIAGAVTGLLMGIVLLHNLQILKWERILMFTCMGIYIAIFLYVIGMTIFIAPFSKPIWGLGRCSKS